jgi:hypothetical protein
VKGEQVSSTYEWTGTVREHRRNNSGTEVVPDASSEGGEAVGGTRCQHCDSDRLFSSCDAWQVLWVSCVDCGHTREGG